MIDNCLCNSAHCSMMYRRVNIYSRQDQPFQTPPVALVVVYPLRYSTSLAILYSEPCHAQKVVLLHASVFWQFHNNTMPEIFRYLLFSPTAIQKPRQHPNNSISFLLQQFHCYLIRSYCFTILKFFDGRTNFAVTAVFCYLLYLLTDSFNFGSSSWLKTEMD